MSHLLFLLLVIDNLRPLRSQDISPLVDIKTLSELPLEKLLQVKQSFVTPDELGDNQISAKVDEPFALALALQAKNKPFDRGGYHSHSYHEEDSKKSGKKSVQSIFQISITTLAFLAFGGYLLCLLSQAIKGKNMMDMTTANTAFVAALLRPTQKRRRTTRRPIRLQNRPKNRRRRPRPKREIWPKNVDSEEMYYALITLSEAYSKYHTVDFRRYNDSSLRHF